MPDIFYVKRNPDGSVATNVPHVLSHRDPNSFERRSDFNWGYLGTGPSELSANILRATGLEEPLCHQYATDFSVAVVSALPSAGGDIPKADVLQWIESNVRRR